MHAVMPYCLLPFEQRKICSVRHQYVNTYIELLCSLIFRSLPRVKTSVICARQKCENTSFCVFLSLCIFSDFATLTDSRGSMWVRPNILKRPVVPS